MGTNEILAGEDGEEGEALRPEGEEGHRTAEMILGAPDSHPVDQSGGKTF